jgi:hypothetical protein
MAASDFRLALELLVCFRPSIGLHDLERIGRSHEDFGEQRVWIKRDGGDELVELLRRQKLLIRCRRGRRLGRGLRARGRAKHHDAENGNRRQSCCEFFHVFPLVADRSLAACKLQPDAPLPISRWGLKPGWPAGASASRTADRPQSRQVFQGLSGGRQEPQNADPLCL